MTLNSFQITSVSYYDKNISAVMFFDVENCEHFLYENENYEIFIIEDWDNLRTAYYCVNKKYITETDKSVGIFF